MADQPEQLGNYHLTCLLGQGGFADVYLGEHIYLKTQAAIKVLQMRLGNEELEDFLNEARMVARLVHPHIVRVLEFGVEGNTPFLVMDYAPNGTLRQRHPRGARLPLATITQYVKQVAAALQYAHERKLIHRDVKPENMLLGANDDILLSDFGIALVAQNSRSQQPDIEGTAGTLVYMAPEQLQGKPRPATDQYALGIIVYEWLSGDRPFHGTFTEVASQHMFVAPAPLHEKVPTIPPAVEQVVMTALAKDPHQRFASVQHFATALEQACPSVQLHEPLSSSKSLPVNLPSQSNGATPSSRQFRQLPNTLSISVTPILDQPLVSLPAQALPPTLIVPTSDVMNHTPDLASRPTLPLPTSGTMDRASTPPSDAKELKRAPQAIPRSIGDLRVPTPDVAIDHTTLSHTVVTAPDQSTQPTEMIPPQSESQPVKRVISRRAVIMSLAGLASLMVVGSGMAFFVQHSYMTARSLLPTATPAQTPAQTPLVEATQTPTVKSRHKHKSAHVPTPTATPNQQPTATPVPTSTPTPTPTATPTSTPTSTTLNIISSGTTTLYGNNSFDFDQGVEIASSSGDAFWDLRSDPVRTLDPVGKAQLANLGAVDFNSVDLTTLQKQSYSATPLDGNNDSSNVLVNNDVFAVATNGGNHAKVLVLSYGYDLQIQWDTYQG